MKDRKIKFDYSWVIIGIAFLMVLTSLGFCSSGRSIYLNAITDALKIPRGLFSISHSIRYISTTIINIYFGRLVAKFGTKKLICAGFLCLIAFAVSNIVATSIYTFYVGSIFLGAGLAWTGTSMVSCIINRWCKKNKGTITGATLAANGLGGALAIQIISPIIYAPGKPFGYRTSYILVSCILLVMLALVLIFYREHPKDTEETNDSVPAKKRKARGEGWIGMDYSDVVKKPYFYVTLVCIFLTGFTLQGLNGIAFPHMYDIGMDVKFVTLLTSLGSIMLMVSKLSTGISYDRLGMRITMNICLVCAFVSVFGLVLLTNTKVGYVIAFIRSILSSFALPLETVMLPLYASELFGNKSFDKTVGVFVSANYAGFAIGAPMGNILHDVFGSYNIAFIIFSVMMVLVAVSMQFVLSKAHKDRDKILAQN